MSTESGSTEQNKKDNRLYNEGFDDGMAYVMRLVNALKEADMNTPHYGFRTLQEIETMLKDMLPNGGDK